MRITRVAWVSLVPGDRIIDRKGEEWTVIEEVPDDQLPDLVKGNPALRLKTPYEGDLAKGVYVFVDDAAGGPGVLHESRMNVSDLYGDGIEILPAS
ncbi:MAG: hypothetical protein WC495_01605 [Patescibacteria group bacterium]|jgi:hypothetical protein